MPFTRPMALCALLVGGQITPLPRSPTPVAHWRYPSFPSSPSTNSSEASRPATAVYHGAGCDGRYCCGVWALARKDLRLPWSIA